MTMHGGYSCPPSKNLDKVYVPGTVSVRSGKQPSGLFQLSEEGILTDSTWGPVMMSPHMGVLFLSGYSRNRSLATLHSIFAFPTSITDRSDG